MLLTEMPKAFHNILGCSFGDFFLKKVETTLKVLCLLYFCKFVLKETTYETKKNVFYFTSKALFVLEKIKVYNIRYSDFMM